MYSMRYNAVINTISKIVLQGNMIEIFLKFCVNNKCLTIKKGTYETVYFQKRNECR